MLNARECRRQAAVCRAEARVTESIGASTTLMAMARSWAMLAHQMDRLQAIRDQRQACSIAPCRSLGPRLT